MTVEDLAEALEEMAGFLEEVDISFCQTRPLLGWNEWVKPLRKWKGDLLKANRRGDSDKIAGIVHIIWAEALWPTMGTLSDYLIVDEGRRKSVYDNPPRTPGEDEANRRKNELLAEIHKRCLFLGLSKQDADEAYQDFLSRFPQGYPASYVWQYMRVPKRVWLGEDSIYQTEW